MLRLSSFLQGRWVEGEGAVVPIHDATTGAVMAEVRAGGLDRGEAMRWARRVGGPTLRRMSFAQRAGCLKALAKAIHARRDELAVLSRQNYGATRSDAKFDVDGASGTLAWYASVGAGLGDRTWLVDGEAEAIGRSTRFVGQHIRVPREGVALHINAFNFPAWGMAEKLAVSLLAGVPALVKPAVATAPVAWRIVQIWQEEGLLPEGAVSLLVGGAGDLLDHLGAQDVVAFTGSGETARLIRGHARVIAYNVPVNVEADSLNAAVLGPDAEPGEPTFEMFVADVVRDLTQKAGQKCTAIRRIFVPSDLVEPVREAMGDLLARVEVGAPGERETGVGPLATAAQQADVIDGIAALTAELSVFLAVDGAPAEGFFVGPRVFVAGPAGSAVVDEREVFGPVATVLPWDGSAEGAVERVNRGGGGLVVSVYSDDVAWAGAVVRGVAPWHGRVHWGSKRVADQSPGPGTVLPGLVHGGPGKAGGGQELGGLRGLDLYLQRTAVQGDRALLDRIFAAPG